jgi:hypothetical protein
LITGPTDPWMLGALVMELVVTPALYLWQGRVARRARLEAVRPRPLGAEAAKALAGDPPQ